MASDLNNVFLIGRLVRDPEMKSTQSGTQVANFSIANNKTFKTSDGEKKEQVSFFNCVAWGKLGEVIDQYCKKGQRVAIQGRLQQDTWEDADGNKRTNVKINIDNIQFLSSKNESSQSESTSDATPAADSVFSDDDIPF